MAQDKEEREERAKLAAANAGTPSDGDTDSGDVPEDNEGLGT